MRRFLPVFILVAYVSFMVGGPILSAVYAQFGQGGTGGLLGGGSGNNATTAPTASPVPSAAVATELTAITSNAFSNSAINYMGISGDIGASAAVAVGQPLARSGTASQLYCSNQNSGTATGATSCYTIALYDVTNSSPAAITNTLTCVLTCSTGPCSCTDNTDKPSLVAGHWYAWRASPSASPTAMALGCSMLVN